MFLFVLRTGYNAVVPPDCVLDQEARLAKCMQLQDNILTAIGDIKKRQSGLQVDCTQYNARLDLINKEPTPTPDMKLLKNLVDHTISFSDTSQKMGDEDLEKLEMVTKKKCHVSTRIQSWALPVFFHLFDNKN